MTDYREYSSKYISVLPASHTFYECSRCERSHPVEMMIHLPPSSDNATGWYCCNCRDELGFDIGVGVSLLRHLTETRQ